MSQLKQTANAIRKKIIHIACRSRTAHVGSSLSCVDLLTYLYFQGMNLDEKNWENRDIFILSKGHASLAFYATLTQKGLMKETTLEGYLQNDGTLPEHLDPFTCPGIEAASGSLGHGFNIGLGMAFGFRKSSSSRKVYVLVGDGELQEGSIWEGALFAPKMDLENFTALVDFNNLQGYGRPTEICSIEPLAEKWQAFGWDVSTVDGHDFPHIETAFKKPVNGKPRVIIAHTIKGKGVPFMENELKWHYYIVTEELKIKALEYLNKDTHATGSNQ